MNTKKGREMRKGARVTEREKKEKENEKEGKGVMERKRGREQTKM